MQEVNDVAEQNQLQDYGVDSEIPIESDIDPPPDGGYGWVCVAACFTINCFTWGVVSVSRGRRKVNFPVYNSSSRARSLTNKQT